MNREDKTYCLAALVSFLICAITIVACVNTGDVYQPTLAKAKALSIVHAEELEAFEGKIDETVTPELLDEFKGYVRDAKALAETMTELYKPFEEAE